MSIEEGMLVEGNEEGMLARRARCMGGRYVGEAGPMYGEEAVVYSELGNRKRRNSYAPHFHPHHWSIVVEASLGGFEGKAQQLEPDDPN